MFFINGIKLTLCKTGEKQSLCKGSCANRGILMAISTTGPGKGAGILEKPVIERTIPGRESEFDLRCVPKFKVLVVPFNMLM